MATLIASRTVQWPLAADFTFNFDDEMAPKGGGAAVDFGASNTSATTVVAIPLPPGATILSGSVDTTEAFDAATYQVTVGDADDASRYLSATDVKSVGSTALVPTGYVGNGQNLEVIFNAADVCTTGSATVRVVYTVADRSNEVQIA